MKHLITFVAYILLFVSCKVQENQKSESGLNGSVKKVTHYVCPIKKHGEIPKDTTNFEVREISTYDSLGNLIEGNAFYQYNNTIMESITRYSGIGKNRTFTQKFLSGSKDTTVKSYKYVYSDDYHFTIIPTHKVSESNFIMEYTLDKDFRIIKSMGKRGDTIEMADEFEYRVRRNKVIEKTLKRTVEEGETDRIIHIITVPQEYDQYGNPTLVYIYDNEDKKRVTNVGFTFYEYYDDDKKSNK